MNLVWQITIQNALKLMNVERGVCVPYGHADKTKEKTYVDRTVREGKKFTTLLWKMFTSSHGWHLLRKVEF